MWTPAQRAIPPQASDAKVGGSTSRPLEFQDLPREIGERVFWYALAAGGLREDLSVPFAREKQRLALVHRTWNHVLKTTPDLRDFIDITETTSIQQAMKLLRRSHSENLSVNLQLDLRQSWDFPRTSPSVPGLVSLVAQESNRLNSLRISITDEARSTVRPRCVSEFANLTHLALVKMFPHKNKARHGYSPEPLMAIQGQSPRSDFPFFKFQRIGTSEVEFPVLEYFELDQVNMLWADVIHMPQLLRACLRIRFEDALELLRKCLSETQPHQFLKELLLGDPNYYAAEPAPAVTGAAIVLPSLEKLKIVETSQAVLDQVSRLRTPVLKALHLQDQDLYYDRSVEHRLNVGTVLLECIATLDSEATLAHVALTVRHGRGHPYREMGVALCVLPELRSVRINVIPDLNPGERRRNDGTGGTAAELLVWLGRSETLERVEAEGCHDVDLRKMVQEAADIGRTLEVTVLADGKPTRQLSA